MIQVSILAILLVYCSSCDKYLLVDPPNTQLSPIYVFQNDDAATSAVTGIYSRMISSSGYFGSGYSNSVSTLAGMSADEFLGINNGAATSYQEFYFNSLTAENSIIDVTWAESYQYIYSANAVLEGLKISANISPSIKKQLEGEAKFLRAFWYFYLTNFYGDIPLHLSTDYKINTTATKSDQNQIYNLIIKDLKETRNLLGEDYVTTERVRPNRWVATAFLARVYLYKKDWVNAELLAGSVIDNTTTFSLKDDLNEVFLKNSSEAIWQLTPNTSGQNTKEGALFIPATPTTLPDYVYITDDLRNSFEENDKRKTNWIASVTVSGSTYYYPFKYKIRSATTLTEYSMVLRLAEQYLIRAEARINQGKVDLGIQDLNILRKRARPLATINNPNPLPPLSTDQNMDNALIAVEKERRVELFSEWGHRWLDLKRTNRATAILSKLKGANWQNSDELWPLPIAEINANPQIVQNNGY